MAFEYAKLAQLDELAPDNKTLVLDAVLCDALYKGLIKKGELYPTHIPKVTDLVLSYCYIACECTDLTAAKAEHAAAQCQCRLMHFRASEERVQQASQHFMQLTGVC